jgi:hypothetical protein
VDQKPAVESAATGNVETAKPKQASTTEAAKTIEVLANKPKKKGKK